MTWSTRFAAPQRPRYRVAVFEPSTGTPHYFSRSERIVRDESMAWESTKLGDALWQAELCGHKLAEWRCEIQEQHHLWGNWETLTPLTLLARASKK